ncbi:iron ABC transporter permease [Salinisphaera sp. C84B14]|uniref:FecCD family ABC transporter permease n=1 Tax=Salinisphaera sp. C84B14 TaxID=1304155 RepID=UPI00333FC489
MPESRTLRLGRWSRQFDLYSWRNALGAVLACGLAGGCALLLGAVPLSPLALLQAFVQPDGHAGVIVVQLRGLRVLLALLCGASLAVSGWLFQQVMRNALASPDTLGVTAGASAAAIAYLSYLAADWGMAGLPIAAITGALTVIAVVYRLAWHAGTTPLRLILMGIGMAALCGAATTFILVSSPLTTTLSAYVWLTGSVYGANWVEVRQLALCCAGLALALVPLLRHALLAPLDDALAAGLGVRVQRMRVLLTLLASLLAGVAIAWGGAMAFVGLIAPHMARRITPAPGAAQLITSAALGATLVMLSDLLGRTLFAPLDLPAGIFVAAIGTPFFLTLLLRQARQL